MDALAQLTASLAGRYAIEREIGRGGMATVFLARDLRHNRKVALKVLNPELGAVLGVERFLSEIQVTANLQHPNLLPLFDSGEAEGLLFYVMPYVEGESLRARLQREKQLPIDDALRISVAVASALDYAHRHGVIHRDLKPENILLHEGQPLVADFGIALAVSVAGGHRITQTGLSLGTPQYMSPEQATGDRAIDGRTDVYSLGAVIYEMLTGDPPHNGNTAQAIIARVLTDKPRSIRLSRETVPAHVEAAVDRALAKLPADRFATAEDFSEALQGRAVSIPPSIVTPGSVQAELRGGRALLRQWQQPLTLGLATVALLASALGAWAWTRVAATPKPIPMRFLLTFAPDQELSVLRSPLAISPDGRTIVYAGRASGLTQLLVRPAGELRARELAGTDGAIAPTISPDGRWIAFWANGRVQKIPIDGGGTSTIVDGPSTMGFHWGPNEQIALAPRRAGLPISVVSDAGGTPRPVGQLDSARGETEQRWPRMLADGNTILYASWTGSVSDSRIGVAAIKENRSTTLELNGTYPLGMNGDRLVYLRPDGNIMAARVDLRRRKVTGQPISLVEGALTRPSGAADVALTESGTLIYVHGSIESVPVIVLRGTARTIIDTRRQYLYPRYSPDFRSIALAIQSGASTDIWIYDIRSATQTRLTTEGGLNDRPEWTPDGKRVVFRSNRSGGNALWWQPADGSGPAERLVDEKENPVEGVISPDGKWLLYRVDRTQTPQDLHYVALTGERKPQRFVSSPFTELAPRFSPDGKWVAYSSSEPGTVQVFVRPFPGPGARYQVSANGGNEPVWSRDGRRLVYRSGRQIIAATLQFAPFSVTSREVVVEGNYVNNPTHAMYDVSRDGREFLLLKTPEDERQVIVVVNFLEELRAKTAGQR